jgi:hypothetical protein
VLAAMPRDANSLAAFSDRTNNAGFSGRHDALYYPADEGQGGGESPMPRAFRPIIVEPVKLGASASVRG